MCVCSRVRAGEVVGELSSAAAAPLGLDPSIPVVAGTVDAWASFNGAGMTAKGDAIDVGGAAGGFGVYWDEPVRVPGSFVTIAPLPGLFSIGGAAVVGLLGLLSFRKDRMSRASDTREGE